MPKELTIKQQIKIAKTNAINDRFFKLLEINNLPIPTIEYKFHPIRKWKFDYCWCKNMVALEVEGGVFSGGRHTRGIGFMNDMEKYNTATLNGYKLIRTTPTLLMSIENIYNIKELLK